MRPPPSFVLRHGIPGLVGTALVAVGAIGVGWLPPGSQLIDHPAVTLLRSTLGGSLTARALVLVGLAVLLQAWLVLGFELASRSRAAVTTPMGQVAGILALWCAPLLLAPPLFSRDAYSYYVQGRVLEAGVDPTTVGIGVIPGWFDDGADPMWVESPTPYGPLWLAIGRAASGFAHPNAFLGALLFRLAAVIGMALIAYYLPKLARLHGIDPARAMWLGVLNPVVIMHFVSGAHNDALMVGLLVAGLALAAQGHCAWGAVIVSLAATIKPIALLALPFAGLLWAGRDAPWSRRIRAWLLTAVVMASTVASVYLVVQAGFAVLAATVGTPSGVVTWLSPATVVGLPLGYLTTWLGLTAEPTTVLAIVRLLGTACALGIIAYLALRPAGRSPVRGAALALAALVLLGPVVQPWYLLWFLPLFAATGLSRRELGFATLLTAVFVVHGMIESSTNADNVANIADVVSLLGAIAVGALILLASRRPWRLAFGIGDVHDLMPIGEDAWSRYRSMRWPPTERMRP